MSIHKLKKGGIYIIEDVHDNEVNNVSNMFKNIQNIHILHIPKNMCDDNNLIVIQK